MELVGTKMTDHRLFGYPLDVGIVERILPVIKFLHSSDCKFLLIDELAFKSIV